MSYPLRCHKCGKFIPDKDYFDKKITSKDIWNWDRTELEDVIYFCVKCSEIPNQESEK